MRGSCSPVKNSPVKDSTITEYEEKEKIANNCQEVYYLVSKAEKLIGGEKPFNHPFYWAGFVSQGEG